ncbi:hypothetical protein L6452_09726 [Arctium lappa]|uniref:Uncharacterized protein n=1 Tax=Arctium lappa TaxID=4217 RepID=A0ACB9DL62_ARCLA|nr:hypothetical protein L6452_09726 [Arctium lappa]
MDEPSSFLSVIMTSFAIKRPLEDKLPKADWLLEAWIVDGTISKPTKTFDRPPSFGCVVGDRGNSEPGSVIYSDDEPPSYTDVAHRDASEIASVDWNLHEVNFGEASSTPLYVGEIYPDHVDVMLLSPTKAVPSIWNHGYQNCYEVHSVMCTELMKLVDRIDKIFPEIEAARPRCSSGIQSLLLLITAIDKAKSLVRNCSESSNLYLALTGHVVLSRCKKSHKLLEQSLSQIQNMVPVILASKIALIIAELREMKLGLDPSEEEAGKVIRYLLERYNTLGKESHDKCIRVAALKLHITSLKALLIEQRSIKKLLDKLGEGDSKKPKKQILKLLLGLLRIYGKLIASEHLENDNVVQNQDY